METRFWAKLLGVIEFWGSKPFSDLDGEKMTPRLASNKNY